MRPRRGATGTCGPARSRRPSKACSPERGRGVVPGAGGGGGTEAAGGLSPFRPGPHASPVRNSSAPHELATVNELPPGEVQTSPRPHLPVVGPRTIMVARQADNERPRRAVGGGRGQSVRLLE